MPIKPILREELANSLRMQAAYERELASLPRGSLVKRRVRKRVYWYLVFREGKHVRSVYQKSPSSEDIKKYARAKVRRAQYRGNLSKVKKQIRYLRSILRGKEPV